MRDRKRPVDGTALREKRPSLAEDYEVEDEEKGARRGRERWEREAAIYERTHTYYIARLRGIDCSLRGKSAGNDEEM